MMRFARLRYWPPPESPTARSPATDTDRPRAARGRHRVRAPSQNGAPHTKAHKARTPAHEAVPACDSNATTKKTQSLDFPKLHKAVRGEAPHPAVPKKRGP